MVVKHNLLAANSNRMLGLTTASQSKSTEKLSSGYKINRAADDAAGLSISEKMRRQIRGLTQASDNAQDGVSLCQIADGALNEVHDMLHRAEELAVKASNGTLTDVDRSYLNEELSKLKEEIDRVATTSTFNEINIFSEAGHEPSDAGEVARYTIKALGGNKAEEITVDVEWNLVDASGNPIGSVAESQATGKTNRYADTEMAKFVEKSATDAVAKLYAAYPSLFADAASNGIKIGLNLAKIDGKGGTLASAAVSSTWSTNWDGTNGYKMNTYVLNIDTSDYAISDFENYTDEQKARLGATIAHEMTHLVMYDTMEKGMFDRDSIPKWMVEGMAQTSSGDNGWISSIVNDPSDATIKSLLSNSGMRDYGAGYLAMAYLGQIASGQDPTVPGNVTATNIKAGLNTILDDMAKTGKSLDDEIKSNPNLSARFSGVSDFENKFFGGNDADGITFIKNLVAARSGGAGSVLEDLSKSTKDMFSNPTQSNSNYQVMRNTRSYANAYGSGYTFPAVPAASDNGEDLDLQVGAEANQHIKVMRFDATYNALIEYNTMDVSTVENAQKTIDSVKIGNENVSRIRSYYGSVQNRLEHTIKNLDNVVENTTAAESLIRDTDMATEMVKYSNNNILAQAGQSMLAQSNQSNQGVLALLQ